MERPEALINYKRAEELERILEDADIPVITAMTIYGSKMQKICGEYFYIFKWQEGSITDWNSISPGQCIMAGEIQGRIHSIENKKAETTSELSQIDWDEYIKEAQTMQSEIASCLEENRNLLYEVQEELNMARKNLPEIATIIDEDMDPKNVMWNKGKPFVIDLNKVKASFKGYLAVYDNGFKDYDKVFGLAYTWIEWLEYNITRALGKCRDEDDRQLGIAEVMNTLSRIRYIHDKESNIRQALHMILTERY